MRKEIILIPAYHPEENFIELVKDLSNYNFTIIVVNDGSGVKYNKIFKEISKYAKVISYKENQGKGYALKKGLKYIKKNYKRYIVCTMDCDYQHTISDSIKLINLSKTYKDSLLIGKRIRTNKTPLRSRIGNSITRYVYRKITKIDIYDTQSGLRTFTEKLIDIMINTEGNRYEYEMNVLLNCHKYNILVKEIEIETIYLDNNANSHFNSIRDSYLIYKNILKYTKKEGIDKNVRK